MADYQPVPCPVMQSTLLALSEASFLPAICGLALDFPLLSVIAACWLLRGCVRYPNHTPGALLVPVLHMRRPEEGGPWAQGSS
jgi:hypothetical protein